MLSAKRSAYRFDYACNNMERFVAKYVPYTGDDDADSVSEDVTAAPM